MDKPKKKRSIRKMCYDFWRFVIYTKKVKSQYTLYNECALANLNKNLDGKIWKI